MKTRTTPQPATKPGPEGGEAPEKSFEMSFMRIPVKLYLLTAFLLLSMAGVLAYTAATLGRQKLDGHHINLAGAQRMLTQKLSKGIFEARLGDTEKLTEIAGIQRRFESVLAGLEAGDTELELNAAETEAIHQKLTSVGDLWQPFAEHVETILTLTPMIAEDLERADAMLASLSSRSAASASEAEGSRHTAGLVDLSLGFEWLRRQIALGAFQANSESVAEIRAQMAAQGDALAAPLLGGAGARSDLMQIGESWRATAEVLERLLVRTEQASDAYAYVAARNIELLATMNAAVQEMAAHSAAKVDTMVTRQIVLLALLVAVGMGFATWLIRDVTRPLAEVNRCMERISSGVLDQEALVVRNRDEIGLLANIFNVMSAHLRDIVDRVASVAGGDFSAEFPMSSKEDQLASALNGMVGSLRAEGDRRAAEEKRLSEEQARREREETEARQRAEQEQTEAEQRRERERAEAERQREQEEAARSQAEAKAEQQREQEKAEAERAQMARERRQAEELRERVDLILDVVRAAASGDLGRKVPVSGSDSIGQLGECLEQFFEDLRSRVGAISTRAASVTESSEDLTGAGERLRSGSQETSTQANTVSTAADQVSESIQTVAAAVEELNASITDISRNTTKASNVASDALTISQTAKEEVTKLGDASARIGQVIRIVTSIAEQTNLLALNATIEASRAGESGKGFAVVASEVKELARQTSVATDEISESVDAIQQNTGVVVDSISRIGSVVQDINDLQGSVACALEEQTAANQEIGRSVQDAASGAAEIATSIGAVASQASEATASAESNLKTAGDLTEMANHLREQIAHYRT